MDDVIKSYILYGLCRAHRCRIPIDLDGYRAMVFKFSSHRPRDKWPPGIETKVGYYTFIIYPPVEANKKVENQCVQNINAVSKTTLLYAIDNNVTT